MSRRRVKSSGGIIQFPEYVFPEYVPVSNSVSASSSEGIAVRAASIFLFIKTQTLKISILKPEFFVTKFVNFRASGTLANNNQRVLGFKDTLIIDYNVLGGGNYSDGFKSF